MAKLFSLTPCRRLAIVLLLMLVALRPACLLAEGPPLRILCSTFPIYQITRNVTKGRAAAQVSLMLPAQFGCPHDYTLTPKDMQRLAQTDVLVINGLGMESFMGAKTTVVNPRAKVIDSSQGITDTLRYQPGEDEDDPHNQGINPHLFTSPRLAGLLAANIAAGLTAVDPSGREIYHKNANDYQARMMDLERQAVLVGQALANRRIITEHGVFDYLARDMGLKVVGVIEAHPGQAPSASEMLALIKTAKTAKAGAIFSEPQYPAQVAKTIAREAGIPYAVLDPAVSGPDSAGLDYYEVVMRRNLQILKGTLGGK